MRKIMLLLLFLPLLGKSQTTQSQDTLNMAQNQTVRVFNQSKVYKHNLIDLKGFYELKNAVKSDVDTLYNKLYSDILSGLTILRVATVKQGRHKYKWFIIILIGTTIMLLVTLMLLKKEKYEAALLFGTIFIGGLAYMGFHIDDINMLENSDYLIIEALNKINTVINQ